MLEMILCLGSLFGFLTCAGSFCTYPASELVSGSHRHTWPSSYATYLQDAGAGRRGGRCGQYPGETRTLQAIGASA
jgi:hypothetical protein